ncbi:rhomboid family intramembrane serine protease [Paraflavitalea sp. CAU 1676]|uniref:rhomboid family intramembrane serine protease n=1 Tax=Paraflavitalea sp. CAU 1676 TaxID=3032598 RepID=UPI0023DB562F|nr:rhomboid family intramembrane serine protease [Paraflavitalea sp. CAU 1676]MDF2188627.1 rhomboid family intramembrane serine protease [Paraflavitalea sp. CAU 1676]
MAFGFTPTYVEQFPLESISREDFFVLAVEAIDRLKWNLFHGSAAGLIANTRISWSSWGADVKILIGDTTVTLSSSSTGSEIYDWGKNKKNIRQFVELVQELERTISKKELKEKYEALESNFIPPDQDELVLPPSTFSQQVTQFFQVFIPSPGYRVTPYLLNLNMLLFLLMCIGSMAFFKMDNRTLLLWGANYRPWTLDGQWWRLLSSCFIHNGIAHLIFNMIALIVVGIFLEPIIGSIRYLIVYLVCGLVASATSLWWHDNAISVGASGAIFGLYGVFIALLSSNLFAKKQRMALLISMSVFIVYNLLLGLKRDIDNAAHLGGLVSGIVIGFALLPWLKAPSNKGFKFVLPGVIALGLVAGVFAVCQYMASHHSQYEEWKSVKDDQQAYSMIIEHYRKTEEKALAVYKLPKNTPDRVRVAEIRLKGIPYWDRCLRLLTETESLELTGTQREKIRLFKKYVTLRMRSYELYARTYEEKTDQYKPEYGRLDQEIELLIDSLSTFHMGPPREDLLK